MGISTAANMRFPIAVRFLRKLRGGTQAHLVQCDDGHFYAAKSPVNPQGIRVLVNEYLGSQVFRSIDIATARVTPIILSQKFLKANPEMAFAFKTNHIALKPGVHLGSRFEVAPDTVSIHDFLPEALLTKVNNATDFLGSFVADIWLCNRDARQFVFYREHPVDSTGNGGFRALAIDHGLCLGGQDWNFVDSPVISGKLQTGIYRSSSPQYLDRWVQRLTEIEEGTLNRWTAEIPSQWRTEAGPELEGVTGTLVARKQRVAGLVNAAIHGRPQCFPKMAHHSASTEPCQHSADP